MSGSLTDAQHDWVHSFCGIDPRNGASVAPAGGNGGAGGASPGGNGNDGAEGSSAGTGDPSPPTAQETQIEDRRAKRDARVDEYGIEKPPTSWTEKLTDKVAPAEILNDPSTNPLETVGRALAAAPAALAGHFMDSLSPVDTRGDWHVNMPILGEIGHGNEVAEYQKKRAEHEEEMARQGEQQTDPAVDPGTEPGAADGQEPSSSTSSEPEPAATMPEPVATMPEDNGGPGTEPAPAIPQDNGETGATASAPEPEPTPEPEPAPEPEPTPEPEPIAC